jgi:shikimate kinase
VKNSRNVFLVGLMGAGKTTIGRALAKRLGKAFYDCDREIEARTGVRVAHIFEIEGEDGFRKREAEALDRLTALEDVVVATGGGAVLDPANRERLKSRGFVIYLYAHPRELWQRTRHDRTRPLLQNVDPRQRLEELYAVRDPLYREVADAVVETGRQGVSLLVAQALAKIEDACRLSA